MTRLIIDPEARGRALAEFHARVSPSLFEHIAETGLLPGGDSARTRARDEWDAFALYACVRGLVAAGGFGGETAMAVDAMHQAVLEIWMAETPELPAFTERRDRMTQRYEEYGAIAREGGAAGAANLVHRLGSAAARHMAGENPPEGLGELAGTMHEALAEGAATILRETE